MLTTAQWSSPRVPEDQYGTTTPREGDSQPKDLGASDPVGETTEDDDEDPDIRAVTETARFATGAVRRR